MHVFCHKAIFRIMQYDSTRIQKCFEFQRKFQKCKKKMWFYTEHKKYDAFIEILWVWNTLWYLNYTQECVVLNVYIQRAWPDTYSPFHDLLTTSLRFLRSNRNGFKAVSRDMQKAWAIVRCTGNDCSLGRSGDWSVCVAVSLNHRPAHVLHSFCQLLSHGHYCKDKSPQQPQAN